MKRENWQKVKQIFNDALEIPPSEREAFLDKNCADDADLRRDVEALLKSFADDFLEKPAVEQVADIIIEEPSTFQTGDKIGEYKIIKPLGTGGQGTVYLAEDLQLKRSVAIKFLPPESSQDPQSNKRFKREAQAAAAISHPNICTIHKIEEDSDRTFLVMQYVEGETISNKLKTGKLDLKFALDIAIQIADALAEAHSHNVIHRDIKPANIIVAPNNQVMVLDFGLAKQLVEMDSDSNSSITKSGTIMGTVSYMSPEQSRGNKTDGRTDIWSLGVCLYEMLTGKNPFFRESLAETFAAILSFEPNPNEFPPPIAEIVSKTLQKNVDKRYQTAKDLLIDLRRLRGELSFEELLKSHDLILEKATPKKSQISWKQIVVASLFLLIVTVGGWFYWQNRNLDWARENIKKIEELAKADKTFEAYDLALQVQKYLPNDENIAKLMPIISDNLTVKSEPSGAKIYLRRFQPDKDGKFPERKLIGQTPLENLKIPRGQYLLYLEKEGFAPFTRSVSDRLPDYTTDLIAMPPLEISAKLVEAEKAPDKMVFVSGGEYKLVAYARPTEKSFQLGDFFIDKYEVSNAKFKEFIAAGGYLKKDLWEIPLETAQTFKDKTGLPAPRSWTNQNFPEGKANHPVTDITWHEAAAYAKFRGKSLPTIFQWEKAGRDGKFDEGYDTMPWGLSRKADSTKFLANLGNENTAEVNNFEFGASPYGCLNMAGNVAEWLLNRRGLDVMTAGGGFNDLSYSFGDYGEYPPFYTSNRIGIRLVKNLSENANGAEEMPPIEIPTYHPSSEADFKKWLVHYEYDKIPLESEIVETVQTDSWTREKITFLGANRERAIAYLYLPKNVSGPLQVVHWLPAADVPLGFSSLPHSVESFLTPIIKSGRAVFAVVIKGYNERANSNDFKEPKYGTVEFRKLIVNRITDWRRGLDYLETRNDIDLKHLAFLGLSNGANQGLFLTAIDRRYATAAFVGGGATADWKKMLPENNPTNFAPHISMPKLFLKGRYDEAHPLKTETAPLFNLLREPRRIVIVESGHVPPPEIFAPNINTWLDETLGKVNN